MEPLVGSSLAAMAVGFITSHLGKAATSVANKATEDIYHAVKARFQKRAAAQEALEDLEKMPDNSDMQAALRVQLTKLLSEDEAFAAQLKDLLKEAGKTEAGMTVIKQFAGDDATQIGQVFGDVTFR